LEPDRAGEGDVASVLSSALRREDDAGLAGDAPIMLDASVALEIEDRLLAEHRRVEIAIVDEQLVAFHLRFGDDLAVRVDDNAAGDLPI
jgi:hypothetical protein